MSDPIRWSPHPEVWFLVGAVVVLGLFTARVLGPKVVPAGERSVTRRQACFFWAGVLVLWVASDWPLHDISEDHLYSLHMFQHLLLTLVMPPLFLLATPQWLARLLLDEGGFFARWTRRLSRPVVAMVLFNALVFVSHWPAVVNTSIRIGEVHYLVHLAIVLAAFLVWIPVCGPIPEWRLPLPAQMLYLFVLSILPTVPSAWLILAERPVYEVYDRTYRLWGIGVIDDQQMAGLIMKLVGGMYLWTIITTIFFTWAFRHLSSERTGRDLTEREVLTWAKVEAELAIVGPAPAEPPAESPTG